MPSIINATPTSSGLITSADSSGVLALQTNSVTALTITSSQNVGIGTTNPLNFGGTNLHVENSTIGSIVWGNGTYVGQLLASASAEVSIGSRSNHPLRLGTNDTERMRITAGGTVLIGITSAGSVTASLYTYRSGGSSIVAQQADSPSDTISVWNSATSGNNMFVNFYTEGTATARGNIDYNRAGNAVRYNTTSDERLKENIVDASSALPLINSVKVRSFDWKENGFHVEHGVIAQELETVAPDAVSVGIDKEDGSIEKPWGVDTAVLVPAMIKAIQEQQAMIEELRAEVQALKGAK